MVKATLVEKYSPGTCFGMPGPIPGQEINKTLEQNPELVKYIEDRFNVSEDRGIYKKITQFSNIQLNKTAEGYDFILKDGNCCKITTYQGKVTIEEGEVEKISTTGKSTKNVPC